MSWVETEPAPEELHFLASVDTDTRLYTSLVWNRRKVKNDERFLYYSEVQTKYLPGGIHTTYAIWIDRNVGYAPRYPQIKQFKKCQFQTDGETSLTSYVLIFEESHIIRFNGQKEKVDILITNDKKKMDLFLKELYGIEKIPDDIKREIVKQKQRNAKTRKN
jgi:hypothetical protein